jgi:hypothetical protein
MRDLARNRFLSPDLIDRASRRLAELSALVNRADLAAAPVITDPTSPEGANPPAGLWSGVAVEKRH